MRLLLRVLLVCAASLSIASVASADKPAKDPKPVPPGQATETTAADGTTTDTAGVAPGQARDKADKAEKEKKDKPENHGQEVSEAARDVVPGNPAHTVLGESVGAAPVEGKVLVRLPGSDAITALPEGAPLPVGTVVDATEALVQIAAEAPDGTEQQAVVTGAVFRVDQSAFNGGVTDLVMQHGEFEGCGRPAGKATARAAAARKQGKGEVVRGLWAAGKGRFRTHGRGATATVRGTQWATVDRCNSTTVKVFDGVVDVEDKATGKVTAVRAGERLVVKR